MLHWKCSMDIDMSLVNHRSPKAQQTSLSCLVFFIRNASLEKKKDLEEEIERKQREIIVELCLLNIIEEKQSFLYTLCNKKLNNIMQY
jgi:hypothetical protein